MEKHKEAMSKTKETQVGGNHYKNMAIQPTEYITKNGLGYIEGNIIKYISRYRSKNGLEDLEKAKHYLEMLMEDYRNQPLRAGDKIQMNHHETPRVAHVIQANDSHVWYKYPDDDLEYMQEIEVVKSISQKL